jgi:hypothetical protein
LQGLQADCRFVWQDELAIAGLQPLSLQAVQPRRGLIFFTHENQQVARTGQLDASKHLQPRDAESYSSAEKFIYNPSAWVLHYKAGLKAGPVASLRLQADCPNPAAESGHGRASGARQGDAEGKRGKRHQTGHHGSSHAATALKIIYLPAYPA